MAIKPNMETEKFYRDLGHKAKRAAQLVEKHSEAARRQWIKIGEYAVQVRDSSPPRSGMLDRWRSQYLDGKVHKVELSDAIWCYEHPEAVALVRNEISNPQGIRREWRDIAGRSARDFVLAGKNDLGELAASLGVGRTEAAKFVGRAHDTIRRTEESAAKRQMTKRAEERTRAIEGSTGIAFDDPIPGGPALTGNAAIRQALAQLDAFDVKAARQTLLDALSESGE